MNAQISRYDRVTTLIFLAACVISILGAVFVGVNDNLPGALLALLAATAFVLAFVHRWRKVRQFTFLLLGAGIGLVIFILLNIALDILSQNPDAPESVLSFINSPAWEVVVVVLAMLLAGALLVGAVGALVTYFRRKKGGDR